MSMNLFETLDLDEPLPIQPLVTRRPSLVSRGKATPEEAAQALALAPVTRQHH